MAAEPDLPAAGHGGEPLDRRVERQHAAAVFEVALERQHVAVAVDDAGLRRMERGGAGERGLHALGLGAFQHPQPFDAVARRLGIKLFQRGPVGIPCRRR